MTEKITKNMARNIYFGGSLFFILLFVGLTVDTVKKFPELTNEDKLTQSVADGKHVWEKYNCVGCHTIMGEGAYYAPELANVFDRRGLKDEETFKTYLSSWMASQPLDIENRRKMPQFNLSDKEIEDLANFLIWTSKIDDNEWPPNIEG
ncbi:cytochrome C [Arcobacter sp. CECT 8983]|uniref:c-type cytochrome n=1 Tax=Arcobacter sp. CECT 8983 TaxID=2044508 RepID=UPI00100B5D71|nr:cytochrome c [Arcobacter sp. CECT 8983]RXJ89039.1 cytochrome C [Arcobacter sp. CECT 8983]